MNRARHRIILVIWTVLVIAAAIVFRDRLFPSGKSGSAPAALVRGAASTRLHQELKARNPNYSGRGKLVEDHGSIVAADGTRHPVSSGSR